MSTISSLRAKRSNPDCLRGKTLDCFVARAPRNDGGESCAPLTATPPPPQSGCSRALLPAAPSRRPPA
ncbi:hypothetical protein DCG74_15900 [Bradyrhizobium sp. WBAH42]|nr:hypothetical protein [Bradyrhizobium sp. WBAH30]MDD1540422.1 hypothetical protein [Bradyrhizobium sp. WBAH41]MDD1556133.1 hypothetical protein [Bradyrhizobium sp. WBAH23]MDD1563056.1 hypothetical protein [Bradyrhizobium sp. WBAH33]MDD1588441.1 hypothetical protein [Bradyrhizobium sp. WBAH42]NRB86115.1 hypothetical protein [Bradyrhizobium sp. WBAH10]QCJ89884.1 hypothetical protein DAA57_16340 [Bradyrhizobium yuanmingense]